MTCTNTAAAPDAPTIADIEAMVRRLGPAARQVTIAFSSLALAAVQRFESGTDIVYLLDLAAYEGLKQRAAVNRDGPWRPWPGLAGDGATLLGAPVVDMNADTPAARRCRDIIRRALASRGVAKAVEGESK